jgi:hypothetical protein
MLPISFPTLSSVNAIIPIVSVTSAVLVTIGITITIFLLSPTELLIS